MLLFRQLQTLSVQTYFTAQIVIHSRTASYLISSPKKCFKLNRQRHRWKKGRTSRTGYLTDAYYLETSIPSEGHLAGMSLSWYWYSLCRYTPYVRILTISCRLQIDAVWRKMRNLERCFGILLFFFMQEKGWFLPVSLAYVWIVKIFISFFFLVLVLVDFVPFENLIWDDFVSTSKFCKNVLK